MLKYNLCYWKDPSDSWMDGRRKYHHYLADIAQLNEEAHNTINVIDAVAGEMKFDDIFIKIACTSIDGEPQVPTQSKNIANRSIASTEYVTNKLSDYTFYYSPRFIGEPKAPVPDNTSDTIDIATTAWVNNSTGNYLQIDSPALKFNNSVPNVSSNTNDNTIVNTNSVKNIVMARLEQCASNVNPSFTGIPTCNDPETNKAPINTKTVIDKVDNIATAFMGLENVKVKVGIAKDGDIIPPIDGYTANQCAFFVASSNLNIQSAIGFIDFKKVSSISPSGRVTCYADVKNIYNEVSHIQGEVQYIVFAQSRNCLTK